MNSPEALLVDRIRALTRDYMKNSEPGRYSVEEVSDLIIERLALEGLPRDRIRRLVSEVMTRE